MENNKGSLFFWPNFLGLSGKSSTILEGRELDAWNFLTLCTNGWSVCWLKFVKMEQFCDDSWKSLRKIPELETVPKWRNIGQFQVNALNNDKIMHLTAAFLGSFIHRISPQVALKMMVWKWPKITKIPFSKNSQKIKNAFGQIWIMWLNNMCS